MRNNLLKYMELRNYTAGKLALYSGLSRQTITRIINQEADPKQSQMLAIASTLKVEVWELFDLDYRKYRT